MAYVVNPWDVKGDIDYDKLVKEFGTEKFKKLETPFSDFLLFRRGIIYAQRDFSQIVNAIKQNKPFAMMTGLMPSGKFHFGHKVVADQIIFYQKLGARIFLAVADIEAYVSRSVDKEELRRVAIEEYLINYVALGLDLSKCDFYFQSSRSVDGKQASAYYALASQLSKHATFNEFKAIYGDITPGKMTASLLQASDMLHPQLPIFNGPVPVIVPVGADQDPHVRLARDISSRIPGYAFTKLSSTYNIFLPGLKGGKMSSSDETSFIALSESAQEATRKIKKYAFSGGQASIEEHREKGGNPEVDVAFQMLRFGLEPDDKKLQKIHDDYRTGKLLSGELKQILIDKISLFLDAHHQQREKARPIVAAYLKKHGIDAP